MDRGGLRGGALEGGESAGWQGGEPGVLRSVSATSMQAPAHTSTRAASPWKEVTHAHVTCQQHPSGVPATCRAWLAGSLQTGQGLARETNRERDVAHCSGTSPAPPTARALPTPTPPKRAAPWPIRARAEAPSILGPWPADHLHRTRPHVPPAPSAPCEACQRSKQDRPPGSPSAQGGDGPQKPQLPSPHSLGQAVVPQGQSPQLRVPPGGGLLVPVSASPSRAPASPGEGKGLPSAPGRQSQPERKPCPGEPRGTQAGADQGLPDPYLH